MKKTKRGPFYETLCSFCCIFVTYSEVSWCKSLLIAGSVEVLLC